MIEHGYTAYTHGCRCDICRDAKRAYMAGRRAAGAEPTRYGEVARPAWNDRAPIRGSRVGVRRLCLDIPNHGTNTGYRRGCRCWDCTDANSAKDRARRERHSAA